MTGQDKPVRARLTKPQKIAFAYWRRMWRYLCGSAHADLENAFAAGWLAGRADAKTAALPHAGEPE